MTLRTLSLSTLCIGALMAHSAKAQTVDPCTVYLCMAGISGAGASGGPGCAVAHAYWHSTLAVYSPYFNAPASAARREKYLLTCPGAMGATNTAVLKAIIAAWGAVP